MLTVLSSYAGIIAERNASICSIYSTDSPLPSQDTFNLCSSRIECGSTHCWYSGFR
jgi:hypothetical protein